MPRTREAAKEARATDAIGTQTVAGSGRRASQEAFGNGYQMQEG